jgi:hypothetical protein
MEFLKSGKFRFYILVLLCSVFFSIKIYRNSNPPVTGWDVFGYYLYLPQTVVHKDIKLKNIDHLENIFEKYQLPGTLYQVNELENGNHAIKYTSGWALLNAPFFICGHIYAKMYDYPQDGFSPPYQWSVVIACIFYTILGMFLSAILLLRFFNVTVSTWVFLLLIFGTNYYFIITDSFTMPHLHLFTLYAAFLLAADNWNKNRNYLSSFALGAILALMTLIRPTEIIAALIPLIWGVGSFAELKLKLKSLFTVELRKSLTVIGSFVLVCSPQLLYWKLVSGQFLYYGYDNAGEGFEFLHPNLLNVLFSFRKGWFIYTPLAMLFIAGFFYMKNHPAKKGLLIFYVLNVYIISCWTNWWYAESFSQRPLMHSLPVLILPFGFFMQYFLEKKRYWIFAILIPFTALNIFQTWQANVGIIHGSRMTFAYYQEVFLKTEIPAGADKLLLVDRSAAGESTFDTESYYRTEKFDFSFEKEKDDRVVKGNARSGKKSFVVSPEDPFSYCFEMEFYEITEQDHAWIKVSMWVKMTDSIHVTLPTLVTTFEHKGKPYMYKGFNLETDTLHTYLPGEWFYVESYYLTPELRRKSDKFKAYLWQRGQGKMYVDDMKVEFFEHK